eukprot:GGOE01005991.1.p1 GENE.GGOE01005991.1~~GGOE01005991.1.p1  ORF type:complete len:866 (-),score=163.63 GGOE01005991.1:119-2344(-)
MDNSPESFCIRLYTLPKWEEYAARRSLFESLTSVLTTAYPGRSSRLMVFGSTVTTLTRGIEDCIHLSLPLDSSLVGESSHNRKAVQALREQEDLRPFLDPHVSNPFMVKLKAPLGGPVDCTLGVGTIGIQGSHWLRRYVLQSNIVRPLMVMVDNWERAWGAGISANQRGGRFDRHALQLMVLFFLCHEGLVPYLPPKHVDLATLPAFPEFISFADRTVPWPYVLQMLPHFFRFYAQWPADRVVALSEPPTVVVPREAKGWQVRPFCVEIPHRPALNTTAGVTADGWSRLQAAFEAAAAVEDVRLLFRRPQPDTPRGRKANTKTTEDAHSKGEASSMAGPMGSTPGPAVSKDGQSKGESVPAATRGRGRKGNVDVVYGGSTLECLYAQKLLPSKRDNARRQICFQDLQRKVAEVSQEGDIELKIFGSTVTMLCTSTTDLDVAAIVLPPPRFQRDAIARLKRIHRALASLKSVALIEARIPILKKSNAPAGFPYNFDISCQSDGVVNSHWLRQYVVQYPLVRPLAMLVKEWSKAWNLNNGPRGRMNSYMLNLMLIYFLCHEKIIDYIPPTAVDVTTLEAYPPLLDFTQRGIKWGQVHELMRRFFVFFSQWPAGQVVCLSSSPLAGAVDAKAKLWHTYPFAVEDPFILHFNVALNIRQETWAKLQARFMDAARCCTANVLQLFMEQPFEEGEAEHLPQRKGIRAGVRRPEAGALPSGTASDRPNDHGALEPATPAPPTPQEPAG